MAEPGSIQETIERGDRLTAFHDRLSPLCTHYASLDLLALRDRLGPDFNLVDRRRYLVSLLLCTECGYKGNMTIQVTPKPR